MRKLVLLFAPVMCCVSLAGQVAGDEYHYAGSYEDDFREPVSDTTLFFVPLGRGVPVFDMLTRHNLGFASYRRRGYPERYSRSRLGGLDVSDNGKYPDYGFYSVLREGAVSRYESRPDAGPGQGGMTVYGINASEAYPGYAVGVNYSDRRYRAGLRLTGAGEMKGDWYYAFRLQRKWGRDAYIDGIFTDAATISLALEKKFAGGAGLSLFAVAAPSQRGGRTWATREAFELTANNYYNPSWGWYDRRQRNSKVYTDFTPALVASYAFAPAGKSSYRLSAGWRFGERRRSGLTWFDARNPSADYYMNMPGWFSDAETAAEVEQAWRDGEVAQLDWAGMYEANVMSDRSAVYVLDDRVERLSKLQAAFDAVTVVNPRLRAEWGIRVKYYRSNYFKRVKDMMGSGYLKDVDQFLIDDLYYGDKYHNDMRNPDRIVGQGDTFGYNYDMILPRAELYGSLNWRESRWNLSASAELTFGSMQRIGNYEKETFPGRASFGKSGKERFTSFSLGGCARYYFSAAHSVTFEAKAAQWEPEWENVFPAPESHNHTVPVRNASMLGAEFGYEGYLWGAVGVGFTAYYTRTADETEILRYYDDIYAEYTSDNFSGYSVMTMTGSGKRFWGLEASLSVDITPRLQLRAAGSLNSYTYRTDPRVEVVADVNLRSRLTGARSYLKGYISSPSPQDVAVVSLRYSTYSRWRFEVNWAYAGRRYVSASPVRRTSRIAALGSSPEMREAFSVQERLPEASSMNLYVSKSFSINDNNLFVSVSVNNLLNRKDIIYGGYEQARILKRGSGVNRTFAPFPSRYSYYYPRTFHATLSYNF